MTQPQHSSVQTPGGQAAQIQIKVGDGRVY